MLSKRYVFSLLEIFSFNLNMEARLLSEANFIIGMTTSVRKILVISTGHARVFAKNKILKNVLNKVTGQKK